MEFETRAVHGGEEKNKDKFFGSTIDMASAFPIKKFGESQDFVYSRSNSPTKQDLEKLMANLENGKYAYVFSSGSDKCCSNIISVRRSCNSGC